MDIIIPNFPVEVNAYLSLFENLFNRSEQREYWRYYIAGIISETHRKNIMSISKKVIELSYQSEHHFLKNAPWSREQINIRRLQLWQKEPKTQMSKDGWLIQDDTGQERRYWKIETGWQGTDGVARQYINNVGKVSEGMVFVSTHYADFKKHTPITVNLFWPKKALEKLSEEERTSLRCRNKIDIALDQLKWVAENVPAPKPKRVIVDSWYGSNPRYLKEISNLGYKYIAQIKSNVKIFIRLPGERGRPEHRAEELLTLFKAEDFKRISVRRSDGSKDIKYAVELQNVKVKKVGVVARLVIQVDDPQRIDPAEVKFFLCNDKRMILAEIVRAAALRNWVEVFYREGKDALGIDQAEVRREETLLRHWTLAMVTHSMLETFRLRGDLKKYLSKSPLTWGDVLRLLQDIFRVEFWTWLVQDEKNVVKFLNWLCLSRGLKMSFLQKIITPDK